MKTTLRLEELGMLAIAIVGMSWLGLPWWAYLIMLLGPDVSMLGYLAGNRIGAFSYNFFHHKGVAVLIFLAGLYGAVPWVQAAGIILFGHSSWDRVMGYGLKYETGFGFTHLGPIGKSKKQV